MDLLDDRLENGVGNKNTDTEDNKGNNLAKFFDPKDFQMLFNVSRFIIKLDPQETRVISMICLLFSLTQGQVNELKLFSSEDPF